MRVLVTGASGFVASPAVAALLAAGREPLPTVREPAKEWKVTADDAVVDPAFPDGAGRPAGRDMR